MVKLWISFKTSDLNQQDQDCCKQLEKNFKTN